MVLAQWTEMQSTVFPERALASLRTGPTSSREISRAPEPDAHRTLHMCIVGQEKLDTLARRINAIYREGTLDMTYSIGKLVISELYEGSVELWGEEGTRCLSYRKLVLRGDLLLSPSALCRAVAIYVLCEQLGNRAAWRNLTASHLQEVLALDPAQQERLLRAADQLDWSVWRLRAEASRLRPKASWSRQPEVLRMARALKNHLTKLETVLEGGAWARDPDEGVALELTAILSDVRDRAARLEAVCAARADGSGRPPAPPDFADASSILPSSDPKG
jgi:hypothetical protein